MYIVATGCPNKNEAVACCFSSATASFFWDTLYIHQLILTTRSTNICKVDFSLNSIVTCDSNFYIQNWKSVPCITCGENSKYSFQIIFQVYIVFVVSYLMLDPVLNYEAKLHFMSRKTRPDFCQYMKSTIFLKKISNL